VTDPEEKPWEHPSLAWLHEVRRRRYERTRGDGAAWARPCPPEEVAALSRRLGLNLRPAWERPARRGRES